MSIARQYGLVADVTKKPAVTKLQSVVTKLSKRGRKPKGEKAMTAAERQRECRKRKRS